MNTAVTKSPRAVPAIPLLRGLPTLANAGDRLTSRRDFQTLHCLPTLAPTKFPSGFYHLVITYRENRFLVFCLAVGC